MNFNSRQRGVSLSGLLISSVVLGAVALMLMKLWPIYNEKLKVDQAMEHLQSNPDATRLTKAEIVQALMRQFEVNDLSHFNTPELTKVVTVGKKKGSENRVVIMEYEIRSGFFDNLDLVMNYKKTLEFGPAKTD